MAVGFLVEPGYSGLSLGDGRLLGAIPICGCLLRLCERLRHGLFHGGLLLIVEGRLHFRGQAHGHVGVRALRNCACTDDGGWQIADSVSFIERHGLDLLGARPLGYGVGGLVPKPGSLQTPGALDFRDTGRVALAAERDRGGRARGPRHRRVDHLD